MERYRFIISDGGSFEHVSQRVYANPQVAKAHATLLAKELSEDDTWHGGWISVKASRGILKNAREVGSRAAEFAAKRPKLEHGNPVPYQGDSRPAASADRLW